MTKPSARSAGESEAKERQARERQERGFSPDAPRPLRSRREVHAGAQQETIRRFVFRRERADIYDSPEYYCLSPKATFERALWAIKRAAWKNVSYKKEKERNEATHM